MRTTTVRMTALARALYEAYHFDWYGGSREDAPRWEDSPSQDVWLARAEQLAERAAGAAR